MKGYITVCTCMSLLPTKFTPQGTVTVVPGGAYGHCICHTSSVFSGQPEEIVRLYHFCYNELITLHNVMLLLGKMA